MLPERAASSFIHTTRHSKKVKCQCNYPIQPRTTNGRTYRTNVARSSLWIYPPGWILNVRLYRKIDFLYLEMDNNLYKTIHKTTQNTGKKEKFRYKIHSHDFPQKMVPILLAFVLLYTVYPWYQVLWTERTGIGQLSQPNLHFSIYELPIMQSLLCVSMCA